MDISLIICTYNRAKALSNCLDAVFRTFEDTCGKTVELIVVNNNSTDTTADILKNKKTQSPIPMNVVTESKQGLAAARNRGIKESAGNLIVFTDDDCHPDENYLNDIIQNFKNDNTPTLRGGCVELGNEKDLPLTIQTNPETILWQKGKIEHDHHLGGGVILGCNMMFPRSLYDDVGPFDEHLGAGTSIPGAEDTDFIFRAFMKGYRLEYRPNMIVKHYHGRRGQEDALNLIQNYVLGTGALYAKHLWRHPNIRKTVRNFLFKKDNRIEKQSTTSTYNQLPDLSKSQKIKLALKGGLLYWKSHLTNPL